MPSIYCAPFFLFGAFSSQSLQRPSVARSAKDQEGGHAARATQRSSSRITSSKVMLAHQRFLAFYFLCALRNAFKLYAKPRCAARKYSSAALQATEALLLACLEAIAAAAEYCTAFLASVLSYPCDIIEVRHCRDSCKRGKLPSTVRVWRMRKKQTSTNASMRSRRQKPRSLSGRILS